MYQLDLRHDSNNWCGDQEVLFNQAGGSGRKGGYFLPSARLAAKNEDSTPAQLSAITPPMT